MSLHEPENFSETLTFKVGLLGGSRSGKTKLARKLSQGLNKESGGEWKVIDSYVPRLEKRVGHPFGPIFDRRAYRYNLQVMAERWTLEDEAQQKGYSTITCGTIFETIIYAAAQSVAIPRLTEDELLIETAIAENMMSSFGLLATMTFDYDCLFYLPLSDEGVKADPFGWGQVVDAKLDEVLTGQNKEAIVLDGSLQRRTEKATSTIKALQETRQDLERRIRRDHLTGEEQGDQPGEVSDVSEQSDGDRSGDLDLA